MASDLSNIFKEEIENTLASLLAKTIKVIGTSALESEPSFSSEQCVKSQIKFGFSNINPTVTFYVPTHTATKFEHFMLGGMMPEKDHIDDEIVDAVNEIVSNICGSIVTASNAQNFADLGSAKSDAQGSEIVECSGLESLPNIFTFEIDMDGTVINLLIAFDETILPYISQLRGVENQASDSEAGSSSSSNENNANSSISVSDSSSLSSLLGDSAIENLKLLFDIKLRLSVRLGTKVFLLKDILRWDIGEIIELDQMVNEPLDILINGVKIGEGEAVIVEGKFGIKIRSIGSEEDRLNQISLGKISMDITTAGGFAAGWALVALAITLGGVGFGPYIDIPSVLIVLGGTTGVVVGQYEAKDIARAGKAIGIAFNKVKVESIEELIEKITFYATEIKKHGVMHIEQKVLEETNPFFKEAFQLLVDGTKAESLVPLLETKLEHISKRHETMISFFGSAGGVAGSMGMIGTLVGLVAMLANLSDPSSVGPAMAVALITTLYGALIGTLFAGIIENKLTQKNKVELNACEIIIMGTTMIAEEAAIGDIKMKLNAILAEAPE